MLNNTNQSFAASQALVNKRSLGVKAYELSNHLGNVIAVVSDRKIAADVNTDNIIDNFVPDVLSATDYYAFGAPMPGRQFNSSSYRYGFNGKENDNEVKGTGNQQDYGMRIYDPRIGKFLSVDPLFKDYAWNSTYAFAENDVIRSIDIDGLEKSYRYIVKNDDNSHTTIKEVKYSDLYPGTEHGSKGTGHMDYFYDNKTKKFGEGQYSTSYADENPIRSNLQDIDFKAEKSPPFVSVEAGVKTSERAGNIKTTQKFSFVDNGRTLKGGVSNDVELSSTTGSKFQITTAVYMKGNLVEPISDAPKISFIVPIGKSFYLNMTFRLSDNKAESIELGVSNREQKADIEVKQKSESLSNSKTFKE